jgi:hypothetical protein
MNAIARPPKPPRRELGTGSVYWHPMTSKWRFRTPGLRGVERGGYDTVEEATRRLEDALHGVPVPRLRRHTPRMKDLLSHLRRARRLAQRLGVTLEDAIARIA